MCYHLIRKAEPFKVKVSTISWRCDNEEFESGTTRYWIKIWPWNSHYIHCSYILLLNVERGFSKCCYYVCINRNINWLLTQWKRNTRSFICPPQSMIMWWKCVCVTTPDSGYCRRLLLSLDSLYDVITLEQYYCTRLIKYSTTCSYYKILYRLSQKCLYPT